MTTAAETTTAAEQWHSKVEAALILGCHPRSIERRAEAGQIRTRQAARRGRKPATEYHAADVERIRAEMESSSRGPSELATMPRREPEQPPNQLIATIATMAAALRNDAAKSPGRRWLTLEEAAADSRLSARFLRKLCKNGELMAVWDEAKWKIASDALETWQPKTPHEKQQPGTSREC